MQTVDQFATFNDVEHLPLRTYNRVVMMHNILEDFGKELSQEYIDQFEPHELGHMKFLLKLINLHGRDFVKEQCTKGLKVVD